MFIHIHIVLYINIYSLNEFMLLGLTMFSSKVIDKKITEIPCVRNAFLNCRPGESKNYQNNAHYCLAFITFQSMKVSYYCQKKHSAWTQDTQSPS